MFTGSDSAADNSSEEVGGVSPAIGMTSVTPTVAYSEMWASHFLFRMLNLFYICLLMRV